MNKLLAEIHNKIASNGSNLSDRLEDQLTGNFFGVLRYLPFQVGLSKILLTADFSDPAVNQTWSGLLSRIESNELKHEFWYRHEKSEIDLLLSSPEILIGIEVKYLSGLSSEDDANISILDYRESQNQLMRYSIMLEQLAGNRPVYLLFLAPFEMMIAVRNNLQIRFPHIRLGFMNWQDLHQQLTLIKGTNLEISQQLIVKDLMQLLEKKELVRFGGFLNDMTMKLVTSESYYFAEEGIQWNWSSQKIKGESNYDFKR